MVGLGRRHCSKIVETFIYKTFKDIVGSLGDSESIGA